MGIYCYIVVMCVCACVCLCASVCVRVSVYLFSVSKAACACVSVRVSMSVCVWCVYVCVCTALKKQATVVKYHVRFFFGLQSNWNVKYSVAYQAICISFLLSLLHCIFSLLSCRIHTCSQCLQRFFHYYAKFSKRFASERAASKNSKVIQSFSRVPLLIRLLLLLLLLVLVHVFAFALAPAFVLLFLLFFAFNLLCTNCKTVNARTDWNNNQTSSSSSSNNYK